MDGLVSVERWREGVEIHDERAISNSTTYPKTLEISFILNRRRPVPYREDGRASSSLNGRLVAPASGRTRSCTGSPLVNPEPSPPRAGQFVHAQIGPRSPTLPGARLFHGSACPPTGRNAARDLWPVVRAPILRVPWAGYFASRAS